MKKSHIVINRVAGQLIQDKKRRIKEGKEIGVAYDGKDLLTLLLEQGMMASPSRDLRR